MSVAAETDVYRARFDRRRPGLRGTEPDWLVALREEAMERFEAKGFPTTRDEAWKYTSVAPIARVPFAPAERGRFDGRFLAPFRLAGSREIVFVNGHHAPELGRGEEDGAVVSSLRESLARDPETLRPHLTRQPGGEATAFASLNTALFEDGVVVSIPPGHLSERPVHLLYCSTADGPPAVAHPRTLILAGARSQATVVETYAGASGTAYFTNAVSQAVVADGAILDHYTLQHEGSEAFHVATLAARQGRAARFSDHSVSLGAALHRRDVDAVFDGEGGECTLNGLFVAGGRQHMDNHTRLDHAVPRCSSRELYKGVLDGQARGVFHGTILVRKDAQKTDAVQTNKNLLLSAQALVQSTPALQILADDVKCKHGSTTGQLDPAALFYLRSRGIGEDAARALLTYAFASDVVARMKVEPIRAAVTAFLQSRLPQAAGMEEALA
jgi:Fe-S cluster assembly protein SufD